MGDKQMNLFMKKADQEPKIKDPALIEKEARNMLEPEEQKNVVIVERRIEDKCPKSELADHTHISAICPMCKQEKELQWVNHGGLGANVEICRDCVPKLFEGYGYKEPGYRTIGESTVEIFSETTGWERIKTYWVRQFSKNIFANDLFPLCVYLEHLEMREQNKHGGSFSLDHNTYGITWACARLLSLRARVRIPEDLRRYILHGDKR